MRLRNLSTEDFQKVYETYDSGLYGLFYRHMDPYLNLDQFMAVVSQYGSLTGIYEDELIGFILVRLHLKPKIAEVSVLMFKEHQRSGKALENSPA